MRDYKNTTGVFLKRCAVWQESNKQREQADKHRDIWEGCLLLALGLYVLLNVSACSLTVGVDWHGETAKDDKTFTQQGKK